MAKINSKNKGNRFERDICKALQEWTGYEFQRTPQSGGLRWKKADNISSDIICTDPKHSRRFPFSVECKFHKDIRFEHILLGNKNCKILDFWEQARGDAERANKIPLLVMRYNGMPKSEGFLVLNPLTYSLIKPNIKEDPIMAIKVKGIEIVVIMLSTLFNSTEYKSLYKSIKQHRKLNKS